MTDVARTGAAKRRRERRLRSWLRHDWMTVAAELSAALQHSRDGGQVSHVGVRAQNMDSSWGGRRPGVPEDPGPPQLGVERAACPRSTGLPPLLGLCGGEVHDATLVKFLLRQTPLQRKKEEEERNRKRRRESKEDASRCPLAPANEEDYGTPPATRRSLFLIVQEEEEEEEEEQASSVCLLSWPRSSSTTAVACSRLVSWFRRGSGMCKVGLSGVVPRAVFPSSVLAVVCAGWFCWLRYTSCCVSVYCQCPWRFHRCSSWSRSYARCYPVWCFFCQTAQKTVDFPQLQFAVFLRLFVSGRHLFGVRPWSTRLWILVDYAFWTDSVFFTSWFDSGCMSRQFTEAGLDCGKLRILRSCSSLLVVDIPFVPQWQISTVQSIQLIIVIPLSSFVFGGRCPCCAVVQVLTCRCGGGTRAPTAAAR